MSALAKAKEVFADEDATKAEVEDAEQALAKAIDELKLKEVGKEDKEKNAGAVKTGDSSNSDFICSDCGIKRGNDIFCTEKKRKEIYMLKKILVTCRSKFYKQNHRMCLLALPVILFIE